MKKQIDSILSSKLSQAKKRQKLEDLENRLFLELGILEDKHQAGIINDEIYWRLHAQLFEKNPQNLYLAEIKKAKEELEYTSHHHTFFAIFVILLAVSAAFFSFTPTGLVSLKQTQTQTIEVQEFFNNNASYELNLSNVSSLAISGEYLANNIKIYAIGQQREYLLYEGSPRQKTPLITGNVVGVNESINESNLTNEDMMEPPADEAEEISAENETNATNEINPPDLENEALTNTTPENISQEVNLSQNTTEALDFNQTNSTNLTDTPQITNTTINTTSETNQTNETIQPEIQDSDSSNNPDTIPESADNTTTNDTENKTTNVTIDESETNQTINETETKLIKFNNACGMACLLADETIKGIKIVSDGQVYIDSIRIEIPKVSKIKQIQDFESFELPVNSSINLSPQGYFQGANFYDMTGSDGFSTQLNNGKLEITGKERGVWQAQVYASNGEALITSNTFYITVGEANASLLNNTNLLQQLPAKINEPVRWQIKGKKDKVKAIKENLPPQARIVQNQETEDTELLIYETPAPQAKVQNKGKGRYLQSVSAEENVTNVTSYVDVLEGITKQGVSIYWIEENKQIQEFWLTDENNNGKNDRINYLVPHLSNQSFEINITILNVQSYPIVGGTWEVRFETVGDANLTITGAEDTTFGTELPDDLTSEGITCDGVSVSTTEVSNGITAENYSCEAEGIHTSRVHTTGRHAQKFEFGNLTVFAYNNAGANLTWVSPTPEDGYSSTNTYVEIRNNITGINQISEFKWEWDSTNYTIYNDSLILMMNFNNVSALGENDTHVIDLSKYGNNGTVSGGNQTSSDGKYGRAMQFDGSDDVVSLGNPSALQIPDYITISAWINPSANPDPNDNGGRIISKSNGGTGDYWTIMGRSDRTISFRINNNEIRTTETVPADSWSHIVGTYNGTHKSVYIDGVLVNSTAETGTISTGNNVRIGRHGTSDAGRTYQGSLDEIRVFNRSLSSEEIYYLYASSLEKYDTNKWTFYIKQTKNAIEGLDAGTYTYKAHASNSTGNYFNSTTQTYTETGASLTWVNPTPDDGYSSTNTYVQIRNNITGINQIKEFKWEWDETNNTILNDSLRILHNYENYSSLGENDNLVLDVSGNGNNGTCSGTSCPVYSTGKHGQGMSFDGSNDYLDIPGTEFLAARTEASVSLWVKTNDTTDTRNIFRTMEGRDKYIWIEDGEYGIAVYTGGGIFSVNKGGTVDTDWHHLMFTWDRTVGNISLWVDGVLTINNDTISWSQVGTETPTRLGGNKVGSYNLPTMDYFNGTLDEFRMWDYKLSKEEIENQYMSNLKKYDTNKWSFYINQTKNATDGLSGGTYTYKAHASKSTGTFYNSTTQTVNINGAVCDTQSGSITISSNTLCANTNIIADNITITPGYTFTVTNTNITTGYMNVSGSFVIKDSKGTIWQNDWLNITGNYTLDNSTLRLNVTGNVTHGISIKSGGQMLIDNNSVITNGGDNNYYHWEVLIGGHLSLNNSYVDYVGYSGGTSNNQGIYLEADGNRINNSTLDGYFRVLLVASDSNEINYNNFTNSDGSEYPLYLLSTSANNSLTGNNLFAGTGEGITTYSDESNYTNTYSEEKIIIYPDANSNKFINLEIQTNAAPALHLIQDSGSQDNNIIKDCIINGTTGDGLFAEDGNNNYFINCAFGSDSDADENDAELSNEAATYYFVNTTFENEELVVSTGKAIVQHYFDIQVNDTNGDPKSDALVNITDTYGNLVYTGTTGADGRITTQNLTEYNKTSSSTDYYTNYTINITKVDHTQSNSIVNFTDDYQLNVTLEAIIAFTNPSATPDTQTIGSNTTINITVEDSDGVSSTTMEVTKPDGTKTNYSMTNISDTLLNTWQYNYTVWQGGSYSYKFFANDTLNNWDSSDPYSFSSTGNMSMQLFTLKDIYYDNQEVNLSDPLSSDSNASFDPYAGEVTAIAQGDINNDGNTDLVTAQSGYDTPESNAGVVQVWFGNSTGDRTVWNITVNGNQNNGQLGYGLAVGDIDNDGIDDLMVGHPNANLSGLNYGQVLVYLGPLSQGSLNVSDADIAINGSAENDSIGHELLTADLNADSIEDLIIVSDTYDNDKGRVWVIYGSSTISNRTINSANITITSDGSDGEKIANDLASGDWNGDGINDLAVAHMLAEVGYGWDHGQVYIFLSPINSTVSIDNANATINQGFSQNFNRLGRSIDMGDWNGDGYDDLLAGMETNDTAYIVYGNQTGTIALNTDANVTFTTAGTENFGYSVSFIDWNKDEYLDILASERNTGTGNGNVTLFYGDGSSNDFTIPDYQINGTEDAFGQQIEVLDYNNDGSSDFVVRSNVKLTYFQNPNTGVIYYEFRGKGQTTDLDNILGAENVTLCLDDDTNARICWNNNIEVHTSWDLNTPIEIGNLFAYVNDSYYDSLNSSANITAYGAYKNLLLRKDGVVCTDCQKIKSDPDNYEYTFNVTSFSNYTWEEGNQSFINSTGDKNVSAYLYMAVEYWNTTLSSWVLDDIVINNQYYEINTSDLIKLDLVFNGNWDTSQAEFGEGTYRVYSELRSDNNNTIIGEDNVAWNASWNFTYELNSAPVISTLQWGPDYPVATTDLSLNATCTDPNTEQTEPTAYFEIYKDGVNQTSLAGSKTVMNGVLTPLATVSNTLTTANQEWKAHVWCVDETSTSSSTNISNNITILGDIANLECEENSTTWHACGNITYGDDITGVRVACIWADSANFTLTNVDDSNNFFTNQSGSKSNGLFAYNPSTIDVADSGTWNLTAYCGDTTQNVETSTEWEVSWGTINSSLITPSGDADTEKDQAYTITAEVSCIGAECGYINATLNNNDTGSMAAIPQSGTPFYTFNSSSYTLANFSCLANLKAGDACNVTWQINNSGNYGEQGIFHAQFDSINYSSNVSTNTTTNFTLTIDEYPEVTFYAPEDDFITEDRNITLQCQVTDNQAIHNISIYHNISGSYELNQTWDARSHQNDENTTFLLRFDNSYNSEEGESPETQTSTSFAEGKIGNSVLIDGSDSLIYNTSNNFDINQGTLEFWFYPTQDWNVVGEYEALFNVAGIGSNSFELYFDPSGINDELVWSESTAANRLHTGNIDWEANRWYHFALTWDFTNDDFRMYLDGILTENISTDLTAPTVNTAMYIGQYNDDTLQADTRFDDIRISNYIRSAEEINFSRNQSKNNIIANFTYSGLSVSDNNAWACYVQDNRSNDAITENRSFRIKTTCNPNGDWTIIDAISCGNNTIYADTINITSTGELTLDNVTLYANRTYVDGTLITKNSKQTWWQNDNLTVSGTVNLSNTTLRMNVTSDAEFGINVTGTIILESNANITNGATAGAQYWFNINNGATTNLRDSSISQVGSAGDYEYSALYFAAPVHLENLTLSNRNIYFAPGSQGSNISNSSIEGQGISYQGMEIASDNVKISNTNISNITITGNQRIGIELVGSAQNTIIDNVKIRDVGNADALETTIGIWIKNGATGTTVNNSLVEDFGTTNTGGISIGIQSAASNTIIQNTEIKEIRGEPTDISAAILLGAATANLTNINITNIDLNNSIYALRVTDVDTSTFNNLRLVNSTGIFISSTNNTVWNTMYLNHNNDSRGIEFNSNSTNNTFNSINLTTISATDAYGIIFNTTGTNNISNSTITASGMSNSVIVDSTGISNIINSTANFTYIADTSALINKYWYYDLTVLNQIGGGRVGATVNINDSSPSQVVNELTDSNGRIGVELLLEFTQNSTVYDNKNNYSFTINKTGFDDVTYEHNVTSSIIETKPLVVATDTCSPNSEADWIISGQVSCSNSNITIYQLNVTNSGELNLQNTSLYVADQSFIAGNITVQDSRNTVWQNGNLTIYGNYYLANSSLRMNGSTDGQLGILVNGSGNMYLNETATVTNGETEGANYRYVINGYLETNNANISNAGWSGTSSEAGPYLNNTMTINNTYFNNFIGLVLPSTGSGSTIRNSRFVGLSDSQYGVRISSDTIDFDNNNISEINKQGTSITTYGLYASPGNESNFTNLRIENINPPDAAASGQGIFLDNSDTVNIKNITINNVYGTSGIVGYMTGIELSNSANVEVDNIFISNAPIESTTDKYGILLKNTATSSISNMIIENVTTKSIYLENADNNNFTNINITNTSTHDFVEADGTSDSNIFNNFLVDSSGDIRILGENNQFQDFTITDSGFFNAFGSNNNTLVNFNMSGSGNLVSAAAGGNLTIHNSSLTTSGSNNLILGSCSNSNVTSYNTTFNKSKVSIDGNCKLNIYWPVNVYVNNTEGEDVNSADVNVTDVFSNSRFNGQTISNGLTEYFILKEYTRNQTYFNTSNNHTINASKVTQGSNSITANITSQTTVNITITSNTLPVFGNDIMYVVNNTEDGYVTYNQNLDGYNRVTNDDLFSGVDKDFDFLFYRGFANFNTSSIDTNATITSGSLGLKLNQDRNVNVDIDPFLSNAAELSDSALYLECDGPDDTNIATWKDAYPSFAYHNLSSLILGKIENNLATLNFGFCIKNNDVSTQNTVNKFASREDAAADEPKLNLTWVISNYSWIANTNLSPIDLDGYFIDDDGHDLTWSISGNTNITVNINDTTHVATFVPDTNFTGSETINITGTDPYDASVTSNNFVLTVFSRPSVTSASQTPEVQGYGFNTTINVSITDVEGVSSAIIEITPPGQSATNYTMTNISNVVADTWQYNYTSWINGTHTYKIWANSTNGHWNSSTSVTTTNYALNATPDATLCSGIFSGPNPCANAYDDDWDTYTLGGASGSHYIYFNYTIPADYDTVLWETKDIGAATDALENFTIDAEYLTGSILQLRVWLHENSGTLYWQSYNGTNWNSVHDGIEINTWVYEEQVWWITTETTNFNFDYQINATAHVRTIKDIYDEGEVVNITDPPETYSSPVFNYASAEPFKVMLGDTLTTWANISDEYGITSVTAEIPHESSTDTVNLSLVNGTAYEGIWENKWTVYDTLEKNYTTIITATNQKGRQTKKAVVWRDPTTIWCKQETANSSNMNDGSCGLDYSGSYSCAGTWSGTNVCENLYDEDYDTIANVGFGDTGYYYVNYSKPFLSTSTKLEWKSSIYHSNTSIDSDCFDEEFVQIRITVDSSASDSIHCFDGVSWNLIQNTDDTGIYEEKIWWNITQITYSEFSGLGQTTDLSNIGINTEVENLILDDSVNARIKWLENVTLNATDDLDAAVDIGDGYVYVNSTAISELNKSAEITVYTPYSGLNIYKDGVVCSDCFFVGQNSTTGYITFNVTSFSNYTWEEANQSKINNSGSLDFLAYIYMAVEYYNSTDDEWVLNNVVVNNQGPYQINATNHLKLDTLFNDNWNTSMANYGYGDYRVYVEARDPSNNLLRSYNGSYLNASYTFTNNENVAPTLDYVNMTPLTAYTTDDLELNATCADINYAETIYAFYEIYKNGTNQTSLAGNTSVTDNTNTVITTISNSLTAKPQNWSARVRCYDETSYSSWQWIAQNITIQNTAPGIPSLIYPDNDTLIDEVRPNFNWSAASDPDATDGVDSLVYELNLTNSNGSCYTTYETSISDTNYTVTSDLCAFNKPYNWTVRTYDGTAYSSWATVYNFSIPATFPVIENLTDAPDPQGYGYNVTINADVTDIHGVDTVYVEVTIPSASSTNYSMVNAYNDTYEYNYSGGFTNGTYTYKIWANGTDGYWNESLSSEIFEYQINGSMQLKTLKDSYGEAEMVNLTDPPALDSQENQELVNTATVDSEEKSEINGHQTAQYSNTLDPPVQSLSNKYITYYLWDESPLKVSTEKNQILEEHKFCLNNECPVFKNNNAETRSAKYSLNYKLQNKDLIIDLTVIPKNLLLSTKLQWSAIYYSGNIEPVNGGWRIRQDNGKFSEIIFNNWNVKGTEAEFNEMFMLPGKEYSYQFVWTDPTNVKSTAANYTINGTASTGLFGYTMDYGDWNNDGTNDLLVGSYGQDKAFIYFGPLDEDLNDSQANVTFSAGSSTNFGWHVQLADLNNDNYDDVIISDPDYNNGGGAEGSVFIYLSDGNAGAISTANTTIQNFINDGSYGEKFATGDYNNDSYLDLIIGDKDNDEEGVSYGRAYVYFGPFTNTTLHYASANVTVHNDESMSLGEGVALADVNGDGLVDIVTGGNGVPGKVYVLWGNATGDLYANESNLTLEGNDGIDDFGQTINIQDYNSDGINDIGVKYDYNYITDVSDFRIFYGNQSGTIGYVDANITYVGGSTYRELSDGHGWGDWNGDGTNDLLLGAPGGATTPGNAFIFYDTNSDSNLEGDADYWFEAQGTPDQLGKSAILADFGDNIAADAVLGAPNDDQGGTNRGAVYIFYSSFDGLENYTEFKDKGNTSDLGNVQTNTVINDLCLDDGTNAKICWNSAVTLNYTDNLDNAVDIGSNFVYVNSSLLSELNASANISVNGAYYNLNIFKDGVTCSECSIIGSLGSSPLIFNVTSFSNYTWSEANQSKINNSGSTNFTGYLYMAVEWYNETSTEWQVDDVVINNQGPLQVNVSSELKLDSYFNGQWNTSMAEYGGGSYRVYAEFRDDSNNLLQDYDGTYLNGSAEFSYSPNSAPTVDYINLTPLSAYTADDLYVNATCADVDGADTVYAYWEVYKDGANQTSLAGNSIVTKGENTLVQTVSNGLTAYNEEWSARVRCYDTKEFSSWSWIAQNVTVQNTAPDTPSPIVNTTYLGNSTTENLFCNALITDDDSQALNVSVRWYLNGSLNLSYDYNNSYASGTNFAANLSSDNTTLGDNWSCEVRANDGIEFGSWGMSSNLTIIEINTLYDCRVISESGEYLLGTDIINSSTSQCIDIQANDVVFDCQGNLIDGDDSALRGIYIYRGSSENANVSVQNCRVSGWTGAGIRVQNSDNVTIKDSIFLSNVNSGLHLQVANNILISNLTSNQNKFGAQVSSSTSDINIINSLLNNNSDYGLNLFTTGVSINNSEIKNNLRYDVWLTATSTAQCNNQFNNITGTGDLPIIIANSAVNYQNWNKNVSQLILCNADNSVINNVTVSYSGLKNNGLSVSLTNGLNISNSKFSNSYNGIYFKDIVNSDVVLSNVTANNNSMYGFWNANSDSGFEFYNASANYNGVDGFVINSQSTTASGITAIGNNNTGLYTSSGYGSFENVNAHNNSLGIDLDNGYISLTQGNLSGNVVGVYSDSGYQNNVSNFTIINNSVGLNFTKAGQYGGPFIIYNNFLNNTENVNLTTAYSNSLNTTPQYGNRIYTNGPILGGNYWANPSGTGFSESCADVDQDGFCDSSYTLITDNVDYYPLSSNYLDKTPTLSYTNITPTNATTISDLYVNATCSISHTVSLLTTYYELYNDGVNQTGFAGSAVVANDTNTLLTTLDSSNTLKDEEWSARINCFDGDTYTGWEFTNPNVTIQNTIPTNVTLIYPVNNTTYTFRAPNFNWSASSDPDATDGVDTLTYEINLTNPSGLCWTAYTTGISDTNWTPSENLCVDDTGNNVYNWSVRVYDGTEYSGWVPIWNFSISSVVDILFLDNSSDFGNIERTNTTNTSEVNDPMELQNRGNVYLNISIAVEDPIWDSVALNTSYYQARALDNESGSLNLSLTPNWFNLTNQSQIVIADMNFENSSDQSFIHYQVTAPLDEPPGVKTSTINVTAEYTHD